MISKLFENGICTGFDMKCVNNGDCKSCKTLIEYANQEPQLASDIEFELEKLLSLANCYATSRFHNHSLMDKELLVKQARGSYNNIKQVLVDKNKLIYESQKAQMNMKAKLDKINEILNRKFSISRRLEDIQQELKEETNNVEKNQ